MLAQLLDVTAAGAPPDEDARAALTRGQQCLAAGDRDGAAVALRQAALASVTQLQAHNLIEQHQLDGNFGAITGVRTRIDPQDDVYRYFTGHGTWSSPLRDYLSDGWRTLSELMLLLEAVDRPLLKMDRVLEFAAGHGRFTRHLVKALGAERVTVSDVVPGAVAFSQEAFGVRGFVSSAQPEAVQWPARYDLVFVLSLFSHLPRASWGRWLARLWDAVAPGGLLVFSTHGAEAVARAGVALDEAGFFFTASSESSAIDAQEYGTAFTSEAFVRAQVSALPQPPETVRLTPTWFWNHQDAWVLRRG